MYIYIYIYIYESLLVEVAYLGSHFYDVLRTPSDLGRPLTPPQNHTGYMNNNTATYQ